MATDPTQRHYRAPCPGCGAPVAFRSAQSTHAVCGFCQSTVVRNGDVLQRLGRMAEVFDDHSPLQLMSSGRITLDGKVLPFTLIGRLQLQSANGTWTEWNAYLEDGSSATLGEDNGAYVFTRPWVRPGTATDANTPASAPALPSMEQLRVGTRHTIAGVDYTVTSAGAVHVLCAQGELPKLPPVGQAFEAAELRSADGLVMSMDAHHQPVRVEVGRSVRLEDLQLQGLKDESVKEEKGRQWECPHCGAPVTVQLASSKSVTCGSCKSILSLESGLGAELVAAEQTEPVRLLLALGSVGTLQGVPWQVVGFQHRMGVAAGDDEHFGWGEYLLYHQQRGFAFLVDSEEGWSMVRPTTGAPQMASGGQAAVYMGTRYTLKYTYTAETTYVQGEFYWPVQRGQTTRNRDFASAKGVLSLEESDTELTWSAGDRLSSETVTNAFKLNDKKDLLKRSDPAPVSFGGGISVTTLIVGLVVILIVLSIISSCTSCDPAKEVCRSSSSSGYRSSGGSFGGYSSGGSHK